MFLPENIDLAFPEKYILSIRCAPNGFSFSIHSPSDRSVYYHKSAPFGQNIPIVDQVKKLVFDAGFFSNTFQKTRVIIASPEYSLVPEIYFDKHQAEKLYYFNFLQDETSRKILFSPINHLPIYLLYSVEEELHSFLSRHLWNPQFAHSGECLIPAFLNHNSEIEENRCYVDFHDEMVSLVAFEGNKLMTAICFDNKNRYDAAYFIAGVWEKLAFNQITDFLFFSGNFAQYEGTLKILKKLIRKTIAINLSPKTMIPENEKGIITTDLLTQL